MLFPLGCLLGIIRPIFTLIFAIVLFLGCLGFVLVNSVRDNFLNSDFTPFQAEADAVPVRLIVRRVIAPRTRFSTGSLRHLQLSRLHVDNLAENDVYNRIYSEVLLDPEFEDTTQDLMGDVQVPQEDIVGLAKEIIPPDYLQDQVEGAVIGTIDYLNKDTDDPQVLIPS